MQGLQTTKYYRLNKILKHNAVYNIVIGERSNGKTYAILEYCLNNFIKKNEQFYILRRWKEDTIGRRATAIFSNFQDKILKMTNGQYEGIAYFSGAFYLCTYDKNHKAIYDDFSRCGFIGALSETEHNKSLSYPSVTTIFFDEFIAKNLYLVDEFVIFMNALSTIIRDRKNIKIFMAGNTVNQFCPYFREMGLEHILKMEQGAIDVYSYGDSELKVAVEYCANANKPNNFYFAFNNPKLNMIKSGNWELNIYPHCPIKFKDSDIIFIFFIEYNENIFQCEIVNKDFLFVYIHIKTTELKQKATDLIYSNKDNFKWNYAKNIYKPFLPIHRKIVRLFIANKIFYQDNAVGETIRQFIIENKDLTRITLN